MPGPLRTAGMAATCTPKLMVLETYMVNEQIVARLIQVFQSRKPHVFNTSFDDITHARALLQAVTFLVDYALRRNDPLRVIAPDHVVVGFLQGVERPRGRHMSQTIADIRRKVRFEGARVTFEHGTVRGTIGDEAADQLDVW